jgi:hypothetical protein
MTRSLTQPTLTQELTATQWEGQSGKVSEGGELSMKVIRCRRGSGVTLTRELNRPVPIFLGHHAHERHGALYRPV